MRDLVLLAASGLAREVVAANHDSHRVIGILDDNAELHGTTLDGIEVLGEIGDSGQYSADLLVCIGSGSARRRVVGRLTGLGIDHARFRTFIDDTVRVPAGCEVGAGSILLAGVVMTADVQIGRHTVVMPNVTLTHDVVLHDFVTVAAGVSLGGGVVIDDEAYVGMNSSVRQRVHVGAGTMIGMGAVVLSDVPAGETWAGVPAGRLGRIS